MTLSGIMRYFYHCLWNVVPSMVLLLFIKTGRKRQDTIQETQAPEGDALTGLYNKKTTQDLIERSLEGRQKAVAAFSLWMWTILNRSMTFYGHIVGDKVLKTFGHLLARQFREHDIAGRIGGDEFMVLIRNINNGSIAENRVKKLIDEVRSLEIPEMDGNGITISVGLAFSPEHGTTFMELYRHADTALYQVKQGGRNGFSVYEKAN